MHENPPSAKTGTVDVPVWSPPPSERGRRLALFAYVCVVHAGLAALTMALGLEHRGGEPASVLLGPMNRVSHAEYAIVPMLWVPLLVAMAHGWLLRLTGTTLLVAALGWMGWVFCGCLPGLGSI